MVSSSFCRFSLSALSVSMKNSDIIPAAKKYNLMKLAARGMSDRCC
jgi:hypothetical protein